MSDNRGIGTGREGNRREESLEGHASSSSYPADANGGRSPNVVPVNHPGREIQFLMPAYSGSPTRVGEKMGIFLFEVFMTPSDLDLGCLGIPVEAALDYFPMLPKYPNFYEQIVVCDHANFDWHMTLTYDRSGCFFAMESTWRSFVLQNHLDVMDVLRFYKSVPLSDKNYYLVEIVKRRDLEIIQEFEPEDFLFQLPLTEAEILLKRLFIPAEEVSNHFPAVGIPAETHDMERLYFTDHLNIFWRIKIIYYQGIFQFLINDQFITKHNLEEGDMIKFYKPIRPLNSRHFLVEFVREGVTPTQLGTAATTDSTDSSDSTDSTDRGSDTQSDGGEGTDGGSNTQGDGGGATDRGGNTQGDGGGGSLSGCCHKGWQFSSGGCSMALKSDATTEES